jgi:hypothetical protein
MDGPDLPPPPQFRRTRLPVLHEALAPGVLGFTMVDEPAPP